MKSGSEVPSACTGAGRRTRNRNRVCSLLLHFPPTREQLIWELGLVFFISFFLIILNQLPLMKSNAIRRRRCQNGAHRGAQTNTTEAISVVQTHKQRRGVEPSEHRRDTTLLKAFKSVMSGCGVRAASRLFV